MTWLFIKWMFIVYQDHKDTIRMSKNSLPNMLNNEKDEFLYIRCVKVYKITKRAILCQISCGNTDSSSSKGALFLCCFGVVVVVFLLLFRFSTTYYDRSTIQERGRQDSRYASTRCRSMGRPAGSTGNVSFLTTQGHLCIYTDIQCNSTNTASPKQPGRSPQTFRNPMIPTMPSGFNPMMNMAMLNPQLQFQLMMQQQMQQMQQTKATQSNIPPETQKPPVGYVCFKCRQPGNKSDMLCLFCTMTLIGVSFPRPLDLLLPERTQGTICTTTWHEWNNVSSLVDVR